MEKNMKNIRQEFRQSGVFYTPPELAKTLLEYLDFTPKKVYDPTCGQGNLLAVFADEVEKYGQEIFPEELEKAKERLVNFHGYCGNTLQDDGFKEEKFDCIIANYPFSIAWEQKKDDERFSVAPALAPKSKADWAFMLHMLHHLSDDGVCISLSHPGILYRGNAEQKIRKWFVDNNYIDKIISIPGNSFVDTAIPTNIIVMRKNKTTTDITFIDREDGSERIVPLEEVIRNDYTLSVNTYIQHYEEKEPVDIDAINDELEELVLLKLMKQFDITKIICQEFEPDNSRFVSFVRRAQETINKYAEENGIQ